MKKNKINPIKILEDQKKMVFAWGYQDKDNGFVVLKGSVGRFQDQNKKSNAYKKSNLLLRHRKITPLGNNAYIFLENNEFVSITDATATLLGYNIMEKNAIKKWKLKTSLTYSKGTMNKVLILENKKNGVHAWGKWNANGTFKVLKNSVGTLKQTNSAKEAGKHDRIRKELENNEIIISNLDINKYIFNKDYTFKSIRDTIIFLEGVWGMDKEKSLNKWKVFSTIKKNNPLSDKIDIFHLEDFRKGLFAWGYKDKNDAFVISKHSIGSYSNVKNPNDLKLHRDRIEYLSKKGIIKKNSETFVFVKNFSEREGIGIATFILRGYRIGPPQAAKMWKNEKGVTYFETYFNKVKNENMKKCTNHFIFNRFQKKIGDM